MNVLYLNSANNAFNHALAIFTRASEPAKLETDASAFVGPGLVLREYADTPLVVPSSAIGIFSLPYESSYIAQPRNFYAAAAPGQSQLSQLISFTNPALVPTFTAPNKLKVPYLLAAPVPALIILQGGSLGTPQVQQATISAASQTVDLTGLLSGNTYYALTFVPSYPIAATKIVT